jgi:hypothetical protein
VIVSVPLVAAPGPGIMREVDESEGDGLALDVKALDVCAVLEDAVDSCAVLQVIELVVHVVIDVVVPDVEIVLVNCPVLDDCVVEVEDTDDIVVRFWHKKHWAS